MPDVALSMIVRNEAATLARCLNSVRGAVEEIVIADTGSTDSTPVIAAQHGARLVPIPWENDFSAARNRALEEVRSKWVLSMDADEMLDPEAAREIAALTQAQQVAGYQVSIRNYMLSLEDRIWDRPAQPNSAPLPETRAYPAYIDHENVRLFRRDPRIRFVGRVHESVGPRIEALNLQLGRASFLIHHFGLAANAETKARKNHLYRELGRQKALDMPENAQARLELGIVELDNFGNVDLALECFERACKLNPKMGIAWFFSAQACFRQGRFQEALDRLNKAQKCGHSTVAVLEAEGDCFYNLGRFAESVIAYRKAQTRLSGSASLESKLGLAVARSGAVEDGIRLLRHAIVEGPHVSESHDRLIMVLVWADRKGEAAVAAEEKLRAMQRPAAGDFARAASLWAEIGNWARATAMLHVGLQLYPNDRDLKQLLGDLAARQGSGVNQLVTMLQNGAGEPFQN